ncbi:MAG: MopE-related protein [Myxococcota bacterium]
MRPGLFLLLSLVGCRGTGDGPRVDKDTGKSVTGVVTDTDEDGIPACDAARDADGDGWDSVGDGGTDCDDFDLGVNPAALDPVVDGIDTNCDGIDGPVTETCAPTGREVCDGVDDDCDGRVDDAFAIAVDTAATVVLAGALLDGGAPALVMGKTSAVPTIDGAVSVYDAAGTLVVTIEGTGQSPSFGAQVASGRDLTGDGVDDLVVAAPYAVVDDVPNRGRVFVFAGPLGPDTTLADAVSVLEGGELDGQIGTSLALAPDITGDGRAELIVGYYRYVLLYSGAPVGVAGIGEAAASWVMNTGGGAWAFATTPDADGDLRPELLLGMATLSDTLGVGFVGRWNSARIGTGGVMGAADLVYDRGGTSGIGAALVRVGDATWTLAGTTPVRLGASGVDETLALDATGLANGGDLDGDGADDLLVATADGLVAIGATGVFATYAIPMTLQSDRSLAPPTDVDGDGVPDPRAFSGTLAAALDGALAFGGSCDADGDGVGRAEGDCDDDDPGVTPTFGRETCDGVDNDCDGVVDAPAEAPLPVQAVWASPLGDLDGDGNTELATLDATGAITLFDGEGLVTARATVTGGRATVPYPFAGVGDTDGDGLAELLVSGEAAVWRLPAGMSGAAVDLAEHTIVDGTRWAREGRVGHAGDLDGDGLAELWVGVRDARGSRGLALLAGDAQTVDDGVVLATPESWDTLEVAAARPGATADLDNDGHDDLLVGNPRSAYGDGRAYVFLRVPAADALMDDASSLELYGQLGEQMGTALAIGGDLDDDGVDDALLGGSTGVRVLSGAACPLLLGDRWEVGVEALAIADLDGDGRTEAWLGDDDANNGAGAIWRGVWREGLTIWRAGAPGEALGSALWAVGDTDGSTGEDLLYRTGTATVRVGGSCR